MRKMLSVAAIAFAVAAAAPSCTLPRGGDWAPTMETWTAGDSIMVGNAQPPSWVDALGIPLFNTAVGSRGFTTTTPGTIEEALDYWISYYGAPQRVLISAGANDQLTGATAANTIAAMSHLETWLTSLGTEVIWITATRLTTPSPLLTSTNNWIRTRPHFIDCGPVTGEPLLDPAYAWDSVHLNDAGDAKLSACVKASPLI